MSYVEGLSSTLAEIAQIQQALGAIPAGPGPGGFEGVLQQISAISALSGEGAGTVLGGGTVGSGLGSTGAGTAGQQSGGQEATTGRALVDPANWAAGSLGWPLQEGLALPGGTGDEASPAGYQVPATVAAGTGNYAAGELAASEVSAVGGNTGGLAPGQLATADVDAAELGEGSDVSAQDLGEQAVGLATQFLGVPYLWGGTNPAQGVDCSGLVQDVYAELGISLPRTSQEQATVGAVVPSLADAEPGDLVFFPGSDGTASSPGHVGIYIGNGLMVDAPHTGTFVQVSPVGDPTEIRRVTGLAEPSEGLGSSGTFATDFAAAAATYGVPLQLLSAVASTESSFQPGAVSSAGAEGLMQLMPSTAASMGVNPFDPAEAIDGAAQLLSSYHERFGSWSLALAAYNAGAGAVDQYSGVPPYPQTQAYVQTVLAKAGMVGQ